MKRLIILAIAALIMSSCGEKEHNFSFKSWNIEQHSIEERRDIHFQGLKDLAEIEDEIRNSSTRSSVDEEALGAVTSAYNALWYDGVASLDRRDGLVILDSKRGIASFFKNNPKKSMGLPGEVHIIGEEVNINILPIAEGYKKIYNFLVETNTGEVVKRYSFQDIDLQGANANYVCLKEAFFSEGGYFIRNDGGDPKKY